eukprot:Ihof_evm3s520 gene=Ihof_evmTU3s520
MEKGRDMPAGEKSPEEAEEEILENVVARYKVIQTNNTGLWGKVGLISKVMVISSEVVALQDPKDLTMTHVWPFTMVTSVAPGPGPDELSLGITQDKNGKTGREKVYTFSCTWRHYLLADLHKAMAVATKLEPVYYAGSLTMKDGEHFALIGVAKWELSIINARTLLPLAVLPLAVLPRHYTGEILESEATVLVIFAQSSSGHMLPVLIHCHEREEVVHALISNAKKNLGIDLVFRRTANNPAVLFEQERTAMRSLIQRFADVSSVCDYNVMKVQQLEPGRALLH